MKSVGVDIGTSHIKVVEVQSTSKGFQVLNYQIHPLTRVTAADQEIEVIEFLRELAQRHDLLTTRFNFALRQDRVAIRNKIFPFKDRIKINKSLAFELEEDIPFSSDASLFDAKIVQYHGNSTEVLACAVLKSQVQSQMRVLQDGGLDPHLISTEGTALANCFERWDEPPPQGLISPILIDENAPRPERPVSIVLNIGHTRTVVCAYENTQLVGVRSILWGGSQIVEAIAKKYNLPIKEAQKEMELKAFILTQKQEANFEAKIFSDLISKCVRDLARDLQLVLLEFKAEFNGSIRHIDMIGGVSLIQGLGPFLTQLLEVPVNKSGVLNQFHNVLFDKSDVTQTRLGVALGLAIEGLKKPRNPAINFLRGEFAKQSNYALQFWQKWGPSLKWSTVALLVLFVWSVTRSTFSEDLKTSARENLKQQAKNVAGIGGRGDPEKKIKEYIRSNSKRTEELKKVANLANMNSALEILKKVNDATPSKGTIGIDVRNIHIVDSHVIMQGYLRSNQELTLLQQALTNVAADGKVNVQATKLPPWNNKTPFTLSFLVDRNIRKGTQ